MTVTSTLGWAATAVVSFDVDVPTLRVVRFSRERPHAQLIVRFRGVQTVSRYPAVEELGRNGGDIQS
jgi:hypothetical protein